MAIEEQPSDSTAAWRGTVFGVGSAIAYTLSNLALRKLAGRHDVDWAIWVSCLKALPTALVSTTLVLWQILFLRQVPRLRALAILLLTGQFMHWGGNVAFQWALSHLGLAVVVPLSFATLLLSVAVLGRIFLEEPVSTRSALAIALLILAICTLSLGGSGNTPTGDQSGTVWTLLAGGAAALSGIAYGVGGIAIRRFARRDASLAATLCVISVGGVITLGLASLWQLGATQLAATSANDLRTMLLAGSANVVAFFGLSAALSEISAVRANMLNATQIAMCAVAGVAVFDERLTVWLVAGIALTVAGLLLMDRT